MSAAADLVTLYGCDLPAWLSPLVEAPEDETPFMFVPDADD